MRFTAVILARVGSTRLERKALRDLQGLPLVGHAIGRAKLFPEVIEGGGVVMAIPENKSDDELVVLGEELGVKVVRGSEDDVLSRIIKAVKAVDADVVYRVTADNPLVDPGVVEATWREFMDGEWDYAVMEETPLGTTAEIVTLEALEKAANGATGPDHREHPTLGLYENSGEFRMKLVQSPEKWRRPDWRFTVDREEDFVLVDRIVGDLGRDATLDTIVPYLDANPDVAHINAEIMQQGWERLKERKDAIGRQ